MPPTYKNVATARIGSKNGIPAGSRSRWQDLTQAQREQYKTRFRHRYATDPRFRAMFRGYAAKRRANVQTMLAGKIRLMTLSWFGRAPTHHIRLMGVMMFGKYSNQHLTFFDGRLEIDHKVPLSKFDLTRPEHIVRACYSQNLQFLTPEKNRAKRNHCPRVNIMSLPWSGNPQALELAGKWINKQLANHRKRKEKHERKLRTK